jgi:hypothetical protein
MIAAASTRNIADGTNFKSIPSLRRFLGRVKICRCELRPNRSKAIQSLATGSMRRSAWQLACTRSWSRPVSAERSCHRCRTQALQNLTYPMSLWGGTWGRPSRHGVAPILRSAIVLRSMSAMTHQLSPSITLDVGYSYIMVKDAPINVVKGHPDFADLLGSSFVAVSKQRTSIVSFALRTRSARN